MMSMFSAIEEFSPTSYVVASMQEPWGSGMSFGTNGSGSDALADSMRSGNVATNVASDGATTPVSLQENDIMMMSSEGV